MPINPRGKPPGSYGPPPQSGCLMAILEGIFRLIEKLFLVAFVVFLVLVAIRFLSGG